MDSRRGCPDPWHRNLRPGVVCVPLPTSTSRTCHALRDRAAVEFDVAVRFCGPSIALSQDGTHLVYVARDSSGGTRIYSRPTDRLDPAPIRGTEGARAPFFSPNGEWIGFVLPDNKLQQGARQRRRISSSLRCTWNASAQPGCRMILLSSILTSSLVARLCIRRNPAGTVEAGQQIGGCPSVAHRVARRQNNPLRRLKERTDSKSAIGALLLHTLRTAHAG